MKVYKTAISHSSLIKEYQPFDFSDAFKIDLPRPVSLSADDIEHGDMDNKGKREQHDTILHYLYKFLK